MSKMEHPAKTLIHRIARVIGPTYSGTEFHSMWRSMLTRLFRSPAFHFGIPCIAVFCLVIFACVPSGGVSAQRHVLSPIDTRACNADCTAYMGDFDLLLHQDDAMVAARGKKPENRSHILMQADGYIRQHRKGPAGAAYFRYLSCVSSALWSEHGTGRTLFSAENIIETYFALAGPNGEINPGIQRACQMLDAYHSRFEQAQDEQNILQTVTAPLDPDSVWHAVLLDDTRQRAPTQDAEAGLRLDQERYCLFAATCRAANNSPFAGR
jgi:hypothetical protein